MLLKKYDKKNLEYVQGIGLILICISILLGQFVHGILLIDFLEGLLMGISIPLLLVGIYYSSRSIREPKRNQEEQTKNN